MLTALQAAEVTLSYRLPRPCDADYRLAHPRVVETLDLVRAALGKAERSAAPGGMIAFMQTRWGKNWVLARRSNRLAARYGAGLRCVSPREYRQAELDYLNGVAP